MLAISSNTISVHEVTTTTVVIQSIPKYRHRMVSFLCISREFYRVSHQFFSDFVFQVSEVLIHHEFFGHEFSFRVRDFFRDSGEFSER